MLTPDRVQALPCAGSLAHAPILAYACTYIPTCAHGTHTHYSARLSMRLLTRAWSGSCERMHVHFLAHQVLRVRFCMLVADTSIRVHIYSCTYSLGHALICVRTHAFPFPRTLIACGHSCVFQSHLRLFPCALIASSAPTPHVGSHSCALPSGARSFPRALISCKPVCTLTARASPFKCTHISLPANFHFVRTLHENERPLIRNHICLYA